MDTVTSGLQSFTNVYGTLSRAKAQKEAGARADDENRRREESHQLRMAEVADERRQAEMVAQADAGAQGDRAQRQADSNRLNDPTPTAMPTDRLYAAVERQGVGPISGQFSALAAAAMDSMELGAAAAYIEHVEQKASTMTNSGARSAYLDSALYAFEAEGAQREVGEIKTRAERLIDAGAIDEEKGGAMMEAINSLDVGLSQAATRSDFAAVRGGVRKLSEGVGMAVEKLSQRKAAVAKREALGTRFSTLGNDLIQKGETNAGLAYLELATKFPGMSDKDISAAIKGLNEFGGQGQFSARQDAPGVAKSFQRQPPPSPPPGRVTPPPGGSEGSGADVPRGTEQSLSERIRERISPAGGPKSVGGPSPQASEPDEAAQRAERLQAVHGEMVKRARTQAEPIVKRLRETQSPEDFKALTAIAKRLRSSKSREEQRVGKALTGLMSADPDFKDPEIQKQLDDLLAGVLLTPEG